MNSSKIISTILSLVMACVSVSAQNTAVEPSNTLPIIYINTEDGAPIVDKINAINAGMYITVPEGSEYEALGTPDETIELTIRGRGNASWTNSPKKPYKLKFTSKTSVLGLPKSKHYALLHHNSGWIDYFASMAGMELARITGESWAPHQIPVEVVLNGSYDGLYFLAETIKIDKNRLNIYEQEDQNIDPELVPYGWLVEVDNYDDECQIRLPETPRMDLRITYHSPEDLSEIQETWLINEFTAIIRTLYEPEQAGQSWYDKIDIQSVARYFIVREVMHDTDAYSGSLYMHRDKGENAKWNFGPLWDITTGDDNKSDWVLNNRPAYTQCHLIEPIMNTPEFHAAVSELWHQIYPEKIETLQEYIDKLADTCREAEKANKLRWPEISSADVDGKAGKMKRTLRNNSKWINENDLASVTQIEASTADSSTEAEYYNLQGIRISKPDKGMFIERRGTKASLILR